MKNGLVGKDIYFMYDGDKLRGEVIDKIMDAEVFENEVPAGGGTFDAYIVRTPIAVTKYLVRPMGDTEILFIKPSQIKDIIC
ncbi:hypothetical protein [Tenacibaculum phage Larrie]|nr:hypothetical protein [Tenacibaculum phage Larrie]